MAVKTIIVTSCDKCGTEEGVVHHEGLVDGKAYEIDACDDCWAEITAGLAHARRVRRRRKQRSALAK